MLCSKHCKDLKTYLIKDSLYHYLPTLGATVPSNQEGYGGIGNGWSCKIASVKTCSFFSSFQASVEFDDIWAAYDIDGDGTVNVAETFDTLKRLPRGHRGWIYNGHTIIMTIKMTMTMKTTMTMTMNEQWVNTIYAIKNAAPYKQVHDLPLLHTQHLYPHTIWMFYMSREHKKQIYAFRQQSVCSKIEIFAKGWWLL